MLNSLKNSSKVKSLQHSHQPQLNILHIQPNSSVALLKNPTNKHENKFKSQYKKRAKNCTSYNSRQDKNKKWDSSNKSRDDKSKKIIPQFGVIFIA